MPSRYKVSTSSKCLQKVKIFIGQGKSQQFQAKVSNFYNYHRKTYLKIMFVKGGNFFLCNVMFFTFVVKLWQFYFITGME